MNTLSRSATARRPRADMQKLKESADAYNKIDNELEDVETEIESANDDIIGLQEDLKSRQDDLIKLTASQTSLQSALNAVYVSYTDAWNEVGEDNIPDDFDGIDQRSAYSTKNH